MYDFEQELKEESPYILMGELSDDTIYIYSSNDYRHSKTSDELKKLTKHLGIDNIKIVYYKGEYEDEEDELNVSLEDFKTATYYHGTCFTHYNNIKKFGLKPNKETNFKDIHHSDKVFLTTNKEKALFHARKCSGNNDSFPIILELNIPDISKLLPDYDLAINFYGKDSEKFIKNYGTNHNISKYVDKSVIYQQIDDSLMDFTKKLGIYAYNGRIPSSHISNILLDIDLFDEYLTSIYFDEEYEMDWNRLEGIRDWTKYSFKEIDEYIPEHEDNLQEELD